MKKRAILVGASPTPRDWLKKTLKKLKANPRTDLVIGVDGGASACVRAGVKPLLAIGDWDSGKPPQNIRRITLRQDKDRSDLSHALEFAAASEADEIIALAVTGARPDHHLAALFELSALNVPATAIGPEGEYQFLSKAAPEWKGKSARPGRLVSVFALGDSASGVTLTGFKFPLKDFTLTPSSRGLSNLTVARNFAVRLKRGRVVIVLPAVL